jgi:type II secretory pathway pseudopilin PulG
MKGLGRRPVRRSAEREGGNGKREGGFTLVELLIAMLLTLVVTGALCAVVIPARDAFAKHPETADMHQRLRVAVDALTRDLQIAGAGLALETSPPVMPYRVGALGSDPDAGVFYRPGVVSVASVPSSDGVFVSRTYYLRIDPATRTRQLMRYDGLDTDLPVVDRLIALELTYFDEGDTPLDPAELQDGPWRPSDPDVGEFDADLLRIRRVRVVLRVTAARDVPDHELQFDVALRNVERGG